MLCTLTGFAYPTATLSEIKMHQPPLDSIIDFQSIALAKEPTDNIGKKKKSVIMLGTCFSCQFYSYKHMLIKVECKHLEASILAPKYKKLK